MKNIIVTGANRGIGLEFIVQYLTAGEIVVAACRNPKDSNDLKALKKKYGAKLLLVQMDVSSEDSIINAVPKVQREFDSLDLLINNAGTYSDKEKGLSTLDMNTMCRVFSVNTFGPVLVGKHFSNLLCNGVNPMIVNIISGMGFITNREFVAKAQYSYSASKAALNMCIKYMAADLALKGISVIGLGPGFVLTDMTKESLIVPPLKPKESVRNMIRIIETKTMKDTGEFYENDGRKIDVIVKY